MPPRSLDTTELTWPEIRDAIAAGYDTILVAAGSTEQHGPHLPEMTDTLIGTHLVRAIAERLPNALQGPTISIGCSEHHMAFAGSVTLRTETFVAVVQDVAHSLARHGFRTIVFIPSHGGNFGPLAQAMAGIGDLGDTKVVAFTDLVGFVGVLTEVSARFGITPEVSGAHAGENETSLDLLLRPDLVRMEHAAAGYVGPFDEKVSQIIFAEGMPALTQNGILGDARPATADHGRVYLDTMADFLAQWVAPSARNA
jgi:creatinine amidohydrolase/Fe(II)-dependent formamide hydrolase-like protein